MKKLYTLLILAIAAMSASAQTVTIPNAAFKARLIAASTSQNIAYDVNGNRIRIDINNDGNIQVSEALTVYKLDITYRSLTDITGIEAFTNITKLYCNNNSITSINVSTLTSLTDLRCFANRLTTLNISGITTLQYLDCNTNMLTALDYSASTNLGTLACAGNQLTSVPVANLTSLTLLSCSNNLLTTLDVSHNTLLTSLNCSSNQLSVLDLSQNTLLTNLSCTNTQLTSLSTTASPGLLRLLCNNSTLTTLDVTGCNALTYVDCGYNQLTALNLANRPNLTTLYCTSNLITDLNITGDTAITDLTVATNQIPSLDVSFCTQMHVLCIDKNPFTSPVNINGLINMTSLFMRDVPAAGIPLTAANAPTFTLLTSLDTKNTPMGNFNYGLIPSLEDLQFINTGISTIDFTHLTNVNAIQCGNNQLTSLDLTPLVHLGGITFWNNPISSITFGNHPELYLIFAGNNNLTDLDLSMLPALNDFSVNNSPLLQTLNVKNGYNGTGYNTMTGCPNLRYICADDGEISGIQTQITTNGYTNCHVNTYCTFEPGGTFYTIRGNHRWDTTNNGCDSNDFLFPNMKFNISNGTTTTTFISGNDGSYTYDVPAGTYTVTPVLENASYFTATPSNTGNIVFPTASSPFSRDFCVRSNADNPDLEVSLYATSAASPGFNYHIRLVYKNKGGVPQSGYVTLAFDDAIQDYVTASVNPNATTTGSLRWNFSNLLPFESKVIDITLNLNSVTETPPVYSGSILHYNAAITGNTYTDIFPTDNTATINQRAVNAYDPNDKTCAEGDTVTPDIAGKYVHYVIRFENTGNANAQNIVIRDIIDTTKFDITTLIPQTGSHPFETKITNTNQVEFVFEHINLPFDDANNDGFVAFKIQTKPTLVVGDTFSNTANIYFDYNFPITTNTATTTLAILGTQDFDFGNLFALSPVPAKNVLRITSKQNVFMSSASIYNTLGQLVQVITNPAEAIDVSGLKTGSYFIKIISDKGTSSSKFLKE